MVCFPRQMFSTAIEMIYFTSIFVPDVSSGGAGIMAFCLLVYAQHLVLNLTPHPPQSVFVSWLNEWMNGSLKNVTHKEMSSGYGAADLWLQETFLHIWVSCPGNGVVEDSFGILTEWLLQLIHHNKSPYTLVLNVKDRVFTLSCALLCTLFYNSDCTLLNNSGRAEWRDVSWRILLAIAVISLYRVRYFLPEFWASSVGAYHILFAQPEQLELQYYRVKTS